MSHAYYNDSDPAACAWLRELIRGGHLPVGDVDSRSIADVRPADLVGYTQCHFFAGIGGWPLALQLAGWPDDRPVWTGSCPCQPFSAAGKRKGHRDERHLWPAFRDLIGESCPPVVFGEQVASTEVVGTELEAAFVVAVRRGEYARANRLAHKLARSSALHYHRRWVDAVRADLEDLGYTLRSEVLGAHSAGAPHIRQRLFWVADAEYTERRPIPLSREHGRNGSDSGRQEAHRLAGTCGEVRGLADAERAAAESGRGPVEPGEGAPAASPGPHAESGRRGHAGGVDDSDRPRRQPAGFGAESEARDQARLRGPEPGRAVGGVGHAEQPGLEGHGGLGWVARPAGREGAERYGAAPGAWDQLEWLPCRDGKSRPTQPGIFPLAHGVSGRVGLLRGYGNAIVPQVAAAFVSAYMATPTPAGRGTTRGGEG